VKNRTKSQVNFQLQQNSVKFRRNIKIPRQRKNSAVVTNLYGLRKVGTLVQLTAAA